MSTDTVFKTLAGIAEARSPDPGSDYAADPGVIGLYGNGPPDCIPAVSGYAVVDVKSVPAPDVGRQCDLITDYIEPFVDDYARHFLHRLGSGVLNGLRAVVFSRDDASAYVAYQYALELRCQRILPAQGPELILWNVEQGESEAVRRFNQRQLVAFQVRLQQLGGGASDADRWQRQLERYRERQALLVDLEGRQAEVPRLSAVSWFDVWHAQRFLSYEQALGYLPEVVSAMHSLPERKGPRLGLVGTALDDRHFYSVLDECGVLVADLQPFGGVWPLRLEDPTGSGVEPTEASILDSLGADPWSPRSRNPGQWLDQTVARCRAAGCDFVVAQMDQNDDTFGWDIPPLQKRLKREGIGWINLGFRNFRPDAHWYDQAREIIRQATGVTSV